MRAPRLLPAVLLLGVVGLSTSGPLARLAASPALTIAFWRLTLSLGIIGFALGWSGEWREYRHLGRGDLVVATAAGVALAAHFWSWISSLTMTTVSASVVLVNLHPVVIVLGSVIWFGERPSRWEGVGLGLAMMGGALVALGDVAADGARPAAALGNLLAVVGAVTVGGYYLAGRHLRARLGVWAYVGLVYGACWLAILGAILITGTPWRPESADWPLLAAIAAGPMLLGHTGFNWALRYVPAYVISLVILGEPVGASLLALVVPAIRESPSPSTLLGGLMLVLGLAGALLARRETS